MTRNVLTHTFAQPLNDTAYAKVAVNAGDGNLTIDSIARGDPELATGSLQYGDRQGPPRQNLTTDGDTTTLTLDRSGGPQRWLHLPWEACNEATDWQIHLNPAVPTEISAHCDGGNVRLNLAGMAVTGVSADSGGGNVEVTLPETSGHIRVTAKTGAGNVDVCIPSSLAARVVATSGLGRVSVDPRFSKIDNKMYQSPGFDSAVHRVELIASSGAGNVTINTI